jgi:hypothetical protein
MVEDDLVGILVNFVYNLYGNLFEQKLQAEKNFFRICGW